MTTFQFHTKTEIKRANHFAGYIAHMKHTLSNPEKPDTVLCLVVRQEVPGSISIQDQEALEAHEGAIIEPVLRLLAAKHGYLK